MARLSRVVVPGVPHHVTQRGARRMRVFFSDRDYRAYLEILARMAGRYKLDTWAYCLMPNHVHLVVVPASLSGLARPVGEAHRLYAVSINRREGWTGHLWQERFSSFPMDEAHLLAAVRYVLLNPVRSGLSESPEEWPYSSARAHLEGESDSIVNTRALASRIEDWRSFLWCSESEPEVDSLRHHSRTGRPLGSSRFVERLEVLLARRLCLRKAGRPPRAPAK